MDSAMSEDLEAVRDTVNRFMQTEVVPVMDGYEKRGEFPRELIRRAGGHLLLCVDRGTAVRRPGPVSFTGCQKT